MLFNPAHETYNGRHMGAATAAPDLVGAFFQCLARCKPSTRQAVEILLSVGAWTEASLVIVERELKGWQLRRLVYDDGEWICSLSRQPQLPLGLDDSADAHHDVPACAILRAVEEARSRTVSIPATSVPRSRGAFRDPGYPICCDNFV